MHKNKNTAMFFLLILKKNCSFLFFLIMMSFNLIVRIQKKPIGVVRRNCRTVAQRTRMNRDHQKQAIALNPHPPENSPPITLEVKEIGCHPRSSLSFYCRFAFQPSVQRSISICRCRMSSEIYTSLKAGTYLSFPYVLQPTRIVRSSLSLNIV